MCNLSLSTPDSMLWGFLRRGLSPHHHVNISTHRHCVWPQWWLAAPGHSLPSSPPISSLLSSSFISLHPIALLPFAYLHLSPRPPTPLLLLFLLLSSLCLSLNECSLTSGTYAAGCSIPSLWAGAHPCVCVCVCMCVCVCEWTDFVPPKVTILRKGKYSG